jgi:hypothetical protein
MNDSTDRAPSLATGMVAGLVGYVAVVATVSMLDLTRGRTVLHTAERIGTTLFFRGGPPGDPLAPVLAWNGVHLVVSLAAGLLGALMVMGARRFVGFWWAGLMMLLAVGVYATVAVGALGVQLSDLLDWPTVLTGTAVWLGCMTAYLGWTHRRLRGRLESEMASDR